MTGSIDHVLAEQPRVHAALQQARMLATSHVDPALLTIAEKRIAELLGAPASTELSPAALTATASSTVPDDLVRAVVIFVEQWVVDVATISDEMVASLGVFLDEDQLMDFLHAVLVTEQRIRLDLAWRQLALTQ